MEIAPVPLTVGKAVDHLAATMPQQVLCRSAEQTLTACELDRQATALACALVGRGLRHGARVALLMPAHQETLVAAAGVARAGGIVELLLPDYGVVELPRMLALAPPHWLFYAPEHVAEAEAIAMAFGPEIVALSATGDGQLLWSELLEEGADGQAPDVAISPADDALILFTSGSTGTPKAVIRTHNSTLSHGALLNHYSAFSARSTMAFRRFRYEEIGQILASGGTFLLADLMNSRQWKALAAAREVTHFFGVASDLEILMAQVARGAIQLQNLQCIMVGGMATRPELVEQSRALLGREPLLVFGSMETGLLAVNDGMPPESIGQPVPGKELQLLSDGVPVPPGQMGELAARPRGELELGFARDYAGSESSPWTDGWVYTGDLMVAGAGGYLHMVGRRYETINVGGYKVYAPEVERVLRRHEAVLEAAVVGEPDERHGERLVAYVELAPGCTTAPRELRAHCSAHLAAHKVPRRVVLEAALPRTATGKVDKTLLQEKQERNRSEI